MIVAVAERVVVDVELDTREGDGTTEAVLIDGVDNWL